LGKLLTYAGGFDARVLVWIAKELRDEHRKALEWLNERTGSDVACFGVVIEVMRIDDSKPAFNFKPVVFPNKWRPEPPEASPKAEAYRQYFQSLIDELRTKYKFTGAKVGQPQNWYSFSSGLTGLVFSNSFAQGGKVRAEMYIDFGDKDRNKKFFDRMYAEQPEIEKEYGASLTWERIDDKRASRIAVYREGSIDDSAETRAEIQQWSIENLLKLRKVLLPKAKALLDEEG
jgi:hypothetical protein